MKNTKKQAVNGTNDYHQLMRICATDALRRMAGYVPKHAPMEDCIEPTFTAIYYANKLYGYLLLRFKEPICFKCRSSFRMTINPHHQNSWDSGLAISGDLRDHETCICCGVILPDDIPF